MRVESKGVGWDRGRNARWYSLFGRVLVVVGIAASLGPDGLVVFDISAIGLLVGTMLMLTGFVVSLETPRELPGEVHVDEVGGLLVRVGKKAVTFTRAQILGAWVSRRFVNMREYHWVEIATRPGTTVSVRVASLAEARGLVEELGFGPAGRAVRIALAKPSRRVLHLAMAGVAYIAAVFVQIIIAHALFLVVFALLYELLRFVFRPPVLDIGSDAIHVRRGPRRVRVARADVARVISPASGSLIVERKDGSMLCIRGLALDPARVAAAAALIDERLGNRPAPARANAFERGGRGLAEWRAALQTGRDPTYRSTGISVDDATEVLASPASSVEQRIGAALALRIAGEPLDRVRVAAEGTVDAKVRVVLDAIAEGAEDEQLDETLRALER